MRWSSIVLSLLLIPACSFAADGVLEINHVCAVQTGCFPGDPPGYPVIVDGSAGRSYRLSSDLTVPNENTNGIEIWTDDISIDLGGFAIRGPVVCAGPIIVCVPATGTGSGVWSFPALAGVSVRNGSIVGMGSYGVQLGPQAEVTNLRVRSNREGGVSAGANSKVSGNVAYRNGGIGLAASNGSTFTGNTSAFNVAEGLRASNGSTVTENTAYRNGGIGILALVGSTVSRNTAHANAGDGIVASIGATVSSNTVYENGGDGIETSPGCAVLGNAVRQNAGFGLRLATQSGYRENVVTANTGGTVTGGSNLGDNACNGSATCP